MSLLKLMPIAALALAGGAGVQALKKNADIIGKVKVVATQNIEMQGVADAVALAYTETETLPLDNFPAFLKANLREAKGGDKRDRSKDIWDTEYRLAQVNKGFEVRSAGPDKQWNTEDDLKKFYELSGLGPVPAAQASSAAAGRGQSPQSANRPTPPPSRLPTQSPAETQRKVLENQKRLAEKGYPSSQFDLGMRYLTGDGVEKDLGLARQWLEKAAQNGHSQAADWLKEPANAPK